MKTRYLEKLLLLNGVDPFLLAGTAGTGGNDSAPTQYLPQLRLPIWSPSWFWKPVLLHQNSLRPTNLWKRITNLLVAGEGCLWVGS